MSFTERIGKHFDFRAFAWMNGLLKNLSRKYFKHGEVTHDNLMMASDYAFQNLELILLNFEERERIDRTECLLQCCLNPLNKRKPLTKEELSRIVNQY